MIYSLDFTKLFENPRLAGYVAPTGWFLIKGTNGHVMVEDDCCHRLPSEHQGVQCIKVPVYKKHDAGQVRRITDFMPDADLNLTIEMIEGAISKELTPRELIKEFGYLGIKGRVTANFNLLKQTCVEIGADIDWGDWS